MLAQVQNEARGSLGDVDCFTKLPERVEEPNLTISPRWLQHLQVSLVADCYC